ncbi:NUAK1-like protein [Mya arenaria]|uniref:NUAK1-like protein n=1 Tax=Mya arenaria TaxID=6604 RepID=A0ABY7G0Z0_MYAAR|nr:NUAK1-like protein [Mya arenaria]
MKGMPDQTLGDMETVLGDLMSGRKSPLKVHGHRHNLKNRFELKKTLGEGTYGKVKLAVEKTTGQQMAIKYIKKSKIRDEHDLDRIRREIKIMSTLQHQNIVNVKEVFENKDKIILVMECADGGELYDYINDHTLTERDARTIFRNIVSAIKYCHQSGIAHRDLKLENILLDRNNNAKIADFGLSNYFTGQDFLKTYCGSPLYASPEIVNGQPYYGPEVDCWSLGVVLYTLVYGTMPFDGTNFKRLRTQITTGDYYEPDKPSEAAGLIRHLLTVNPAKRATIEDICAHWWVNLGYSVMPDNEPYIPPTVLQPVPSCQKPDNLLIIIRER